MPAKPPDPEPVVADAIRRHRDGDLPRAEALYRQALQLQPGHVRALNGLAALAQDVGQFQAAFEMLQQARANDRENPDTLRNLGVLFMRMEQHDEAIIYFERTLALAPDDALAQRKIVEAERQLRILRDPDYAEHSGRPWSDTDVYWEEKSGAASIFVLFSGLGVGNSPPTFMFYNFLRNCDKIDKLFLRDLNRKWYLGGLDGIANDVRGTAEFIRSRVADYERTVFIGSSAGGLAALLYGELLGADKVLAFAPQTVLTDAKETQCGDDRWNDYMVELRREIRTRHMDLQSMGPLTIAADIHYSANCRLDRLHASRIVGPRVRQISHDGESGHLIALQLRDSGQLGEIFAAEIDGGGDDTA